MEWEEEDLVPQAFPLPSPSPSHSTVYKIISEYGVTHPDIVLNSILSIHLTKIDAW